MKKKNVLMCLSFLGLTLGSCGDNPSSSSEESVFLSGSVTSSVSSYQTSSPSSSSSSLRTTYTIIWKNGDVDMEVDSVYADQAGKPSYDGETPTKESDAQYIYTFDGWMIEGSSTVYSEADLPVILGNTTYIAHYATELRKYNLAWKVGDTVLERDDNVPYGTHPSFEADDNPGEEFDYFDDYDTERYTYTFDGWQVNGEGEAYLEEDLPIVSGDTVYVAHFYEEGRSYYVSWKNGDFTMETDSFEYGAIPSIGITPPAKESQDGYTYFFDGWTINSEEYGQFYSPDSLPPVQGDTTYYIHYGAIKDTGLDLLTASYDNAVAVVNDEAYIFKGGESSTTNYSNTIYKWNPTTGCVDTGVTLPINASQMAAVECNGLIYLIGGATASVSGLDTIYVYNPALGTVTNTGVAMSVARCSPRAVVDGNLIYITGGCYAASNKSIEVFNTTNNTISTASGTTSLSAGATMAMANEQIYLFGRKDVINGGIYSLNPYGPAEMMEANIVGALDYGVALTYQDRIYTIGGTNYTDDVSHTRIDSNVISCYDPTQDSYSDTNIRLPHALSHMSAAVINEKIYVFGGNSKANGVTTYYNTVYEIIP